MNQTQSPPGSGMGDRDAAWKSPPQPHHSGRVTSHELSLEAGLASGPWDEQKFMPTSRTPVTSRR